MNCKWVTVVRHPIASIYIAYLKRLDGDIKISFFLDSDLEDLYA